MMPDREERKGANGQKKEEKVNFHPNRNTATLSVKKEDFLKFLAYTKNKIIWETDEEA